jgi:hypothetical protein
MKDLFDEGTEKQAGAELCQAHAHAMTYTFYKASSALFQLVHEGKKVLRVYFFFERKSLVYFLFQLSISLF